MITLIWALYLQFIFVLVLMALNFLIAIFSQSYESIMDRQIELIIERNVELNQVIERLLGTLQDPQLYKNEIWTRVLRVTIDAPEQVEVHKIRGDIE